MCMLIPSSSFQPRSKWWSQISTASRQARACSTTKMRKKQHLKRTLSRLRVLNLFQALTSSGWSILRSKIKSGKKERSHLTIYCRKTESLGKSELLTSQAASSTICRNLNLTLKNRSQGTVFRNSNSPPTSESIKCSAKDETQGL